MGETIPNVGNAVSDLGRAERIVDASRGGAVVLSKRHRQEGEEVYLVRDGVCFVIHRGVGSY